MLRHFSILSLCLATAWAAVLTKSAMMVDVNVVSGLLHDSHANPSFVGYSLGCVLVSFWPVIVVGIGLIVATTATITKRRILKANR